MSFEFGQDDAKSIGSYLKSVRLQKEVEIDEIAESLKIHSRFLRAIEEDRWDDLPGPVYKELFLKAYADYLGVDLEETLLRLPEHAPQPEGESGEDEKEEKEPAKTERERERDIREDIGKMPTAAAGGIKRTRTHLLTLGIIAIVVVIALVLILQFGGVTSDDSPAETIPTTTQELPRANPDTLPEIDTTAVIERLRILVESRDTSYAEVYADAESIRVGYVLPDDPIRCMMQDSLWLKIGAPEKAQVWIDSLPIRLSPVSNTGVFSATLTRENYFRFVDSTALSESP